MGCGRQVARANGGRAYEVGKTSRGVRDVTTGDRHIRPRREVVDAVEEDVDAVVEIIPGGRDDDRRCVASRCEHVDPLRGARVRNGHAVDQSGSSGRDLRLVRGIDHRGDQGGIGREVVGLGVLAGPEVNGVAPEGEERMIITGGVDREVAIDVEGRLGRVRNMKLRVAHGEALDARLADVGAVLAVVDLRIAVLVVLDGVATAPAGVGEQRIRLGVGTGLRRGRGQDRNLAEAEHLDEGGGCVIADRDLDLFVAIAHRGHRGDGVPALSVGHRAVDRRRIERRVRIVVSGVLVEDR